MQIVVCNKKHDKEIFDYISSKRPNYNTENFQKIYILADDRDGIVQVIDNREGKCIQHKFNFNEYMMFHEQLIMEAAKELFPEGESK